MSNYAKYKDLGDKPSGSGGSSVQDNSIYVATIKSREDKLILIKQNRLCVVDVWGEWCGPCKSLAPHFEGLAKKYNKPGLCVLAKESADLQLSPDVKGVPTIQFFLDGKKIEPNIVGGDHIGIETRIKYLLGM